MAPGAPPTGEVVFCFTDVEGSTRLVLELGTDRWQPLLERHRALVRAGLQAHHGIEIQTEGDGFFAVFEDPLAALEGAVAIQRAMAAEAWRGETPLRVRVGLHLGEGRLDAEGLYVGPDVHRAARIASAAHGGQIVCSEALASAVAGRTPQGTGLRTQGEHRLKDLRPERLWDVVVDGLPADFPPLRSLDARPNNLPTQLTSFVGREREVAETLALLERSRLVTLTGPGGTGKTRLALHAAAAAADRHPDGTWFVALDSISDHAMVLPAVVTVLGLRERPGVDPEGVLAEGLAGKRVLLVLDNFEQVLDAAPSIGSLLRRLPELRILVTSRAVLRISGEQELPVPGLDVPDGDRSPGGGRAGPTGAPAAAPADPGSLLAYEAIRLFVARASAARPDFALTPGNAAAVAAICARLEGMPLAIELAAARVRVLSPDAILDRLGRTLDLLTGGARDLPARQQSLRGAITWSYEVLDEPCRRLLERLAVFAGGATLEDAEVVCGPSAELGQEVLDGLATLVEQSLVRLSDRDRPRYGLLVPIREFALERLQERGTADEVRHRHALRFLARVEEAAPHLTGPDRGAWLDRLDVELENIRAALEHFISTGDAELAWRFVAAAWRFWQVRGHMLEVIDRVRAVLALPAEGGDPELRLGALSALGGLAWWIGDHATSAQAYMDVVQARRAEGDSARIAAALYDAAFPLQFNPGRQDESRAAFVEARERFEALGDADGEARAWWGLANAAFVVRDFEGGRQAARRAADHFRSADMPFELGWSLYTLGALGIMGSELAEGDRALSEALDIFAAVDDWTGVALVLDAMAMRAWVAGDRGQAAWLSGAVARLERSTGTGLNPPNRALFGFDPVALRDEPATADAWAAGEAAAIADVVAEVQAASRARVRESST